MTASEFRKIAADWADYTCTREQTDEPADCIAGLTDVFENAHGELKMDRGLSPWPTFRTRFRESIAAACNARPWRSTYNRDNCGTNANRYIYQLREGFQIFDGCLDIVGINYPVKTYRNRCSSWVEATIARACGDSPIPRATYTMRVPSNGCISFDHEQAFNRVCAGARISDSISKQSFTNETLTPQPPNVSVVTCPTDRHFDTPPVASPKPPSNTTGQTHSNPPTKKPPPAYSLPLPQGNSSPPSLSCTGSVQTTSIKCPPCDAPGYRQTRAYSQCTQALDINGLPCSGKACEPCTCEGKPP